MMKKATSLPAILFAAFTLCLYPLRLPAQPGLEAYDRGDINAVRIYLAGDSLDPAEAQFLRAALTADADSALERYRQVVLKYPESPISQRALDRIRQYYFAQGRYEKAQEFDKALQGYKPPQHHLSPPLATSPAPGSAPAKLPIALVDSDKSLEAKTPSPATITDYCLQVGAFNSSANALKLKSTLQKAGYRIEILDASSSQNRLHTVRVVGFKSEAAAWDAAEILRRQYDVKPILLPEVFQD